MKTIGRGVSLLTLAFTACTVSEPESCKVGDKAAIERRYAEAIERETACLATPRLDRATRARAFEVRAWSYHMTEAHKQAADDQSEFVRLAPDPDYRSWINLALYLRLAGRLEESLVAARKAEKLDTEPAMMTQYHLGWTLAELGRHEEAVAAFTRGIPVQPDYVFAYWRRGLSLEKLGRKGRAGEDFRKVDALLKATPLVEESRHLLPELQAKIDEYK